MIVENNLDELSVFVLLKVLVDFYCVIGDYVKIDIYMVNYLVLVKKLGRELIEFESKLWLNYIGNLVEDCRKFIDKVE